MTKDGAGWPALSSAVKCLRREDEQLEIRVGDHLPCGALGAAAALAD